MLLRLVPRSFGRVMQQANRIYLKMSMVFLQPLHPHLSHDPFPSLRSLDLSSRVTLFRAPRPTSKQKQRRARCYGWEGSFKSFEQFRKLKGKYWKTKCSKKTKKEEVTISVGLLEWKETDMKLKPVRGKRIALRVSNKAPYTVISSKAIEKWKAYQSQLYVEEEEEYMLVFEDGKEAQFLPGTVEFFNLLRYHEEIGKDYKRIVLYLCTTTDIRVSERRQQEGYSSESENSEDDHQFRPGKKAKSELDRDDELAKSLQFKFDREAAQFDVTIAGEEKCATNPTSHGCDSIQEDSSMLSAETIVAVSNKTTVPKCPEEKLAQFTSREDLLRSLGSSVDEFDQFFLVVRRGSSFQRQLKI